MTEQLNQHTFKINGAEFEYTRGKYYKMIRELSVGAAFGEIALLEKSTRTASIKVLGIEGAELAVLAKDKFLESLQHIQEQKDNLQVDFFRNIHSFYDLTKRNILKFVQAFKKVSFTRSQIVYTEGELSNFVYIVNKGEFEQEKVLTRRPENNRLKKLSQTTLKMQNILSQKMPEIKDIPTKRRLNIFEVNSLIGEEDVFLHKTYQCTLRCYSQEGTLFKIKKKDFLKLRN